MSSISPKIRLSKHGSGLSAHLDKALVEEIKMNKGDFLIPRHLPCRNIGRKLIKDDPVLKDRILFFEFRRNQHNRILDIIGDFEDDDSGE